MIGIIALTITLVLLFTNNVTTNDEQDKSAKGAAVTNGYECADIAV